MINIKLDGHQNKLLGVNVMCSGIAAINCEKGGGRHTQHTQMQGETGIINIYASLSYAQK